MKYSISTYLLGISIFFIRLPPFYLLPFSSPFFMSHTISRLLIVFALLFILFDKKRKIYQPNTSLTILFLLWFSTLSLSVVNSFNLFSFLDAYKDVVSAFLLFLTAFYVITKDNIHFFIFVFIVATAAHIMFQLLSYFSPQLTYSLLGSIMYEPYWQFFNYQFERGRFFGDALDESLLPILFFYFFRSGLQQKIAVTTLTGFITFITFASNWRSKFVVFIFGLFSTLFINFKKSKRSIIYIATIIIVFIILSNFLSLQTVGFNVIDRLVYGGAYEIAPITARINYWKEASDITHSSPLTGIGLGNYYDFLSSKSQLLTRSSQLDRYGGFVAIDDPHNILVSLLVNTGVLGLFAFVLLFGYFALKDSRSFSTKSELLQSWIASFWAVALYSMFNPWLYFGYIGLLLFIRGVVEKLYAENL